MNLIARGAEAELYDTGTLILKKRPVKTYRHLELDTKLRLERTRKEYGLLQRAKKANIPVPSVKKIDESTLELEKIDGEKMATMGSELPLPLATTLGKIIAQVHDENIIHGDLTTSNVLHHDGKLTLIDFGLGTTSERLEDKAVDLHVLEEALKARHPRNGETFFHEFCTAYENASKHGTEVLQRLTTVQSRGRNKKQF